MGLIDCITNGTFNVVHAGMRRMCLWKLECLERLLLKIYLYAHELVVYPVRGTGRTFPLLGVGKKRQFR